MSVRLPPQVELIRPGERNTLSSTSSTRRPAMIPPSLDLLAERDDVGSEAELLVAPRRTCRAGACLHLVENEERIVAVAQLLSRQQKLRTEMPVAALALDGLGDEAGDVVRKRLECSLCFGECRLLGRLHLGPVRLERKSDGGRRDPRPVELREAVDLDRVRVR